MRACDLSRGCPDKEEFGKQQDIRPGSLESLVKLRDLGAVLGNQDPLPRRGAPPKASGHNYRMVSTGQLNGHKCVC